MLMLRSGALAALALLASTAATAQDADPHQSLEVVESPASLAWVAAQNAKSLPVLQGDPRYARLHADALTLLSATDRIAAPTFVGQAVFNFWQDQDHVRGVWRRTTLASYQTAAPAWETVLDLDALAKAEGANWIWKGALCRPKTHDRCLVELSNGGKDAIEIREFDLASKAFVQDGFRLPESKQTVEWLDADTLILTRNWGAGTTTDSGYGFVVKTLKRGQGLDQAVEVFRGQKSDVSARPNVLRDGQGNRVVLLERATDFFHTQYSLLDARGVTRLPIPERSDLHGLIDNRLVLTIQEDWAGQKLSAGTLVAADVNALARPPLPSSEQIVVSTGCSICAIFKPGPRQTIDQVGVTDHRVVAVVYDNVRGQAMSFQSQGEWPWKATPLPGIDNAAVAIVATADEGDQLFYSVEGFLTPTQLKLADAASGQAATVKTLPARFDAAKLAVDQHEAVSKDGTKIPYFLVHAKDQKADGANPTLLFAYGGFNLSKLPIYDPLVGKLWLERGGSLAVANIRGGGEFGPAWHEAALKQNRQRAYDDYFAVAEALITTKVTSPRHLGAYGRSNGGLLMGVALTQRPDLWNAVVVESPLLDMLRYTVLPAGASWIGEYGDPAIPAERAYIEKYSPYQNLKPGVKYPLAYITTSTKDDRVHPGHARKFAARLADLNQPYLYFENTDGGHANGAEPVANARRWAMHYVYLTRQLMD
ncbi:MAG: family peptidase [Caulobacter sp.]|nr:family peptidase [Caulobacter sp.]